MRHMLLTALLAAGVVSAKDKSDSGTFCDKGDQKCLGNLQSFNRNIEEYKKQQAEESIVRDLQRQMDSENVLANDLRAVLKALESGKSYISINEDGISVAENKGFFNVLGSDKKTLLLNADDLNKGGFIKTKRPRGNLFDSFMRAGASVLKEHVVEALDRLSKQRDIRSAQAQDLGLPEYRESSEFRAPAGPGLTR